MPKDEPKKVFDPENPQELVKGWALHAAKARRKHEKAARRLDRQRYLIGGASVVLSAIVGASVIASMEAEFGARVTIAVGLLSIAASTLTGFQTQLAPAERAEKHRASAVDYKAALRELEETLAEPVQALAGNDELRAWLDRVRIELNDLERKAPIVPDGIHKKIEDEFVDFEFVTTAKKLG